MARLIDANALAVTYCDIDNRYNSEPWDLQEILLFLNDAPTVDAVEVVRCKDCRHSIWDEENEMWKCVESADYDEDAGEWFGFYEYHNGDFFCADGERKDNERKAD